jgi:hypothetical protein
MQIIKPNRFGHISKMQENALVQTLKSSGYGFYKSQILSEYACKRFNEIKPEADRLIEAYKEFRKEREAWDKHVAYENAKARYDSGELAEEPKPPEEKKPSKAPAIYDYEDKYLTPAKRLIRELNNFKGAKRLPTNELDECLTKLQTYQEEVEADHTIDRLYWVKAEGDKMIGAYQRAIENNQPISLAEYVANLSRVVLNWFDDSGIRKDVEKAECKRKGLLKEFDDYLAYLKKHIQEIENKSGASSSQLTMAAIVPLERYDINGLLLDFPDLKEEVEKYGHLVFRDFDATREQDAYYDSRISRLGEIRKVFDSKKENANPDKASAIEKAVEIIDAIDIKWKAHKCRKAVAKEDIKKARSEIDKLVEIVDGEAKGYGEKFPDVFKYIHDSQKFLINKDRGLPAQEPKDPWDGTDLAKAGGGAVPAEDPKAKTTAPLPEPKEKMVDDKQAAEILQTNGLGLQKIVDSQFLKPSREDGIRKFKEIAVKNFKRQQDEVVAKAERELQEVMRTSNDSQTTLDGMKQFVEKLDGVGIDTTPHREYIASLENKPAGEEE